jgi:precorrin-6B methylase 2
MKQPLKQLLFGRGRRGCKIPLGLYRGLVLSIDPSSETMFFFGLYEAETTRWLKNAGRRSRSLIDVGAGRGEMDVWGLQLPRMERVLAYDASPDRWPIFRENLRLNGLTGDPRLTAVEGYFPAQGDPQNLIDLLSPLPEPVLLKIDVDGGEEAILEHMRPLLAMKEMLILVETHSKTLDRNCAGLLRECGYDVRQIGPGWYRRFVPERRPIDFNQWLVAEKREN